MLYSANISVVNYVDDFGGVSKSESSYFDYQYMLVLLNNLGLDVNFGKCVKPSTEMVFFGQIIQYGVNGRVYLRGENQRNYWLVALVWI